MQFTFSCNPYMHFLKRLWNLCHADISHKIPCCNYFVQIKIINCRTIHPLPLSNIRNVKNKNTQKYFLLFSGSLWNPLRIMVMWVCQLLDLLNMWQCLCLLLTNRHTSVTSFFYGLLQPCVLQKVKVSF